MAIALLFSKVYNIKGFELVMVEGGPEPRVLIANEGHDSDAIRNTLAAKKIHPVIPPRLNRMVMCTPFVI